MFVSVPKWTIILITYRPDYARLSQLTTVFLNLPIIALTATAPRVRDQILNVVPDAVLHSINLNTGDKEDRQFDFHGVFVVGNMSTPKAVFGGRICWPCIGGHFMLVS